MNDEKKEREKRKKQFIWFWKVAKSMKKKKKILINSNNKQIGFVMKKNKRNKIDTNDCLEIVHVVFLLSFIKILEGYNIKIRDK